jgi:Skp family chaperone for outer membrane proteins
MSDKSQVKVYLPEDLHDLLNADSRSNSEVVEAALWREFGGKKKAALEQRSDELRQRISMVQRERNDRERELEELQNALQDVKTQLSERQSRKEQIVQEAVDELNIHPSEGYDHLAAENWAEKAGMDVETFWNAYTEAYHE